MKSKRIKNKSRKRRINDKTRDERGIKWKECQENGEENKEK